MSKTLVATTSNICDVVGSVLRTGNVMVLDDDHVKLAIKREYISARLHTGFWEYKALPKGRHLLKRRLLSDLHALTEVPK